MVTVRVLKRFWDLKRKRTRVEGEVFQEEPERVAQIEEALPGYTERLVLEEGKAEGPDVRSMSLRELKALAKERGIDIPPRTPKDEIITLLEG